jgi:hypothetical protein
LHWERQPFFIFFEFALGTRRNPSRPEFFAYNAVDAARHLALISAISAEEVFDRIAGENYLLDPVGVGML